MKRLALLILVFGLAACTPLTTAEKSTVVNVVETDAEAIATPAPVQTLTFKLSPTAQDLVTDAEVSATSKSHSYYDKHYQTATFAGSGSGPTIAVGVDLAFNSAEFTKLCWSNYFDNSVVDRFAACTGHSSVSAAKRDIASLQDIKVVWNVALSEFNVYEVPNYYELTLKTFPGAINLKSDAVSILVSLVYNRGSSMVGPTRLEMRNLRDLVADSNPDYHAMATQIRKMERIWVGTAIYDGMKARREAEAEVMDQCAN